MHNLWSYLRNNKLLITISIIIYILIFILNYYTPLIADDHGYSFICWTNEKLLSFVDIIKSQTTHYLEWGGRNIAHGLAQLWLMIGKDVFNIINPIMYVLLIFLLCKHSVGSQRISIELFIFMNILVFVFTPVFGQVTLWLIGSSNYLWCMVIMLLFLLPYRIYLDNQKKLLKNKYLWIYFLIIGLLAGWTNENTAGAVILISIMIVILYRLKKINIPSWSYIGIISAISGFFIMISAPGNYIRSQQIQDNYGFIEKFIIRFINLTSQMYSYMNCIFLILLVLFMFYVIVNKNKRYNLIIAMVYGIGSIASIYALILSPQAPPRAFFGSMCLIYIATGCIFNELFKFERKRIKILLSLSLIFGTVYSYQLYFEAYKDIKRTYEETLIRQNHILHEKSKGSLNISVPPIYPQNSYNAMYWLDDVKSDSDFWLNGQVAQYYGLESIKLKEY